MWPQRSAPRGVPRPNSDRFVSANPRSLRAEAARGACRLLGPCSAPLTPPPRVQLLRDPNTARTPPHPPVFLVGPISSPFIATTAFGLNLYPSFLKAKTARGGGQKAGDLTPTSEQPSWAAHLTPVGGVQSDTSFPFQKREWSWRPLRSGGGETGEKVRTSVLGAFSPGDPVSVVSSARSAPLPGLAPGKLHVLLSPASGSAPAPDLASLPPYPSGPPPSRCL